MKVQGVVLFPHTSEVHGSILVLGLCEVSRVFPRVCVGFLRVLSFQTYRSVK